MGIGCAISSVAGAVLYHWLRRFICLLMENSAGANSNFTTSFACAAYSVGAGPYRARVLHLFASWIPVSNDRSGFFLACLRIFFITGINRSFNCRVFYGLHRILDLNVLLS